MTTRIDAEEPGNRAAGDDPRTRCAPGYANWERLFFLKNARIDKLPADVGAVNCWPKRTCGDEFFSPGPLDSVSPVSETAYDARNGPVDRVRDSCLWGERTIASLDQKMTYSEKPPGIVCFSASKSRHQFANPYQPTAYDDAKRPNRPRLRPLDRARPIVRNRLERSTYEHSADTAERIREGVTRGTTPQFASPAKRPEKGEGRRGKGERRREISLTPPPLAPFPWRRPEGGLSADSFQPARRRPCAALYRKRSQSELLFDRGPAGSASVCGSTRAPRRVAVKRKL